MNPRYNYLEAIKDDVKDWLEENIDIKNDFENRDEFESWLYDTLFAEDRITGNASGSYTFSTAQAEDNLCGNLDLLKDAATEFGDDAETILRWLDSPESADVVIRCYLLPQAISEVLTEINFFEE